MKIDIHADDYALTVNTSKDILSCIKHGKLNSISIIPNMSCFDECMELLYGAIPEMPYLPLMSIHINLVEGTPLFKGTEKIPLYTCLSWGKLYLFNWVLGKKNPIRESIYREVYLQIDKCNKSIERCLAIAKENGIKCSQKGVRIDSHQHTHMIPIVWNSCIDAVQDLKLDLEYVRNSYEPIKVFWNNKKIWSSFRLVNIVKNRVLAFYSNKADKLSDKLGYDKMYLWGLIMSGNMDINRVSLLYNNMKELSYNNNRTLEILFHPGSMRPFEINDELNSKAVISFYLNDCRKNEMETVMGFEFK